MVPGCLLRFETATEGGWFVEGVLLGAPGASLTSQAAAWARRLRSAHYSFNFQSKDCTNYFLALAFTKTPNPATHSYTKQMTRPDRVAFIPSQTNSSARESR
jgi:hypothetical protein